MSNRDSLLATLLVAVTALAACGQAPENEPAADTSVPADAAPATDTANRATADDSLPRSAAPAGARLYFVSPADGATVSSPVTLEFGLDGMEVVPAGTDAPASGHHHVIIDSPLPPFDLPIPADANHVHFGDGRTRTELELEPGEHRLQLLLGDHLHIPHDPPVYSETITVTVE